ncbi:MAG: hypothetical protein HOM21_01525, partial [Halobacteriovoraceae bacterium]|nr:hypothetical protein [Halobacteriovoraceae bacterium]
MRTRIFNLFLVLALGAGLSACGTDKEDSTNNAANEYFSSFINSVDGQKTGQKLIVSTTGASTTGTNGIGGTTTCLGTTGTQGFGGVATTELILDSNRTFIVYQNNSNVNGFGGFGGFGGQPQPTTNAESLIRVADGQWSIEGSRLVLEGFGSTGDYGINNNPFGNQTFGQTFFGANSFNVNV